MSRGRTAANVGGLFFPQSKSLGIDRSGLSPTLQAKVVRAGTKNSSFAQGSDDLRDYLQLKIDPKQVERVTERIGAERWNQRDAEVEKYMGLPLVERKGKPAEVTAPALAVVSVDGGRLQIRGEPKASATEAEEALPADDGHKGKHWREDKIGLLMTMTSEEKTSDPCPEVLAAFVDPTRIAKLTRELKTKKSASVEAIAPEVAGGTDAPEKVTEVLSEGGTKTDWVPPEMKTQYFTATRRPWASLGPMVAQMAWKLSSLQGPTAGVRGRWRGQRLDGMAESLLVVRADPGHHSRDQLCVRGGAGGSVVRGGMAPLCAVGDMGVERRGGESDRRTGSKTGGTGIGAGGRRGNASAHGGQHGAEVLAKQQGEDALRGIP